MAYETWVGAIPEGHVVRHKCDNPPCINPDHLETGSIQSNVDDREARKRARHPSGSDHWSQRMSLEKARAIRELYASGGATMLELAKTYGCSTRSISLIVRNKTWKEQG